MTVRVLIADDQPLMRSALRGCLSGEQDIEVVAEATNGQQAVDLVRDLQPDVALLDLRMPVMDGVEATRRIVGGRQASPTRVIAITTFELDDYVVSALRAGASGFLLKDATPEELVHAVRVVAAGDALLSPPVTRRLLERFARSLPATTPPGVASLTPRERTVLQLVARGATNAQIASELYLAESSVKTHIGHLLSKLHVPDRVHLVIYAYEIGLVLPATRLSDEPERSALD
jgi:DNA-binding NarL/FixJ family response regulator